MIYFVSNFEMKNINNMIMKSKENWELYYKFEDILHKADDKKIIETLNGFNPHDDYLTIPIIFDLINYKKIELLKLLHKKNIPLTYEDDSNTNGLHIACGAGGSLECVKFLVENNILTDIHKKSAPYGDTPLTLAICYEHKDITNYLMEKFKIEKISLEDLYIILDRMKLNYRKHSI